MSKPETMSELTAAAAEVDQELRRFEQLADLSSRIRLDSEKNLQRASQTALEAAESHDRLGERVRSLVEAVTRARARQQASAEALQARSGLIQQRTQELQDLLGRFGKLGEQAKSINLLLQETMAQKRDAAVSTDAASGMLARLEEVRQRMGATADEAAALGKKAEECDLTDLVRMADSLRQQVLSAKNKLHLLEQGLSAQA